MTFLELAEKVLTEKKVPMKTGDIWSYGVEKGYDSLINSSGKTPWATLAAQLYSNVKDNPRCRFDVTQTRPKRFFMKSLDNIDKILIEVEKEESSKVIREERELKKKQYLEKELHPLLAYYAFHYLRCYTKTINHSKSSKKEFGEWVHPDMVGCDFEISSSQFSDLGR